MKVPLSDINDMCWTHHKHPIKALENEHDVPQACAECDPKILEELFQHMPT